MDDRELTPDERDLLRAWLQSRRKEEPPPEQLAAWLSGRLDEAAGAVVEEALAVDGGMRAAVLALRERTREVGSAQEVARCRALWWTAGVTAAPAAARRQNGRLLRSLPAAGLATAAAWLGWKLGLALAADGLAAPASAVASLLGAGPAL